MAEIKAIGQDKDSEIAALKAQLAAMTAAQAARLSAKVSEKGALSVYGLGRFPVTLYSEQWQRLAAWIEAGHLKSTLEANRTVLATKAARA